MNLQSLPFQAFLPEASAAAARALAAPCTLTLQLPTAAQACSPGERPMGSVVKIEVDGKPLTDDAPARVRLTILPPALLTLTF